MNPNPSPAQSMVAAVGHHGLWGYSSTFDFLEALETTGTCSRRQSGGNDDESEPIRILLVHPGDIRHIMTTISRRRRHKNPHTGINNGGAMRPIHFYLMETPVEVIGRELMSMEILFDFEVPIRQRAGVFLEVYGNALVQERTSRYLERLGYELRDLILDGTGRLEGVVDLSCLKYREKDDLERCWKSYARSVPFDMSDFRDHRLRGWHGDRYDHRKKLADMDYHAEIRDRASIIHIKQFKEWRVSGIAYELGDHVYTEPNRTMMTFTEGMMKKGKDTGLKKNVKGYWGDIVSSPYFSFGIDADSRIVVDSNNCNTAADTKKALKDAVVSAHAGTGATQLHKHVEGLFEVMNKNTGTEQHRHHTVEVSMYNLFSVLWELETGVPYKMNKAHDIYSGLGEEAGFAEDIAKQEEAKEKEKEIEQELGVIDEDDDEDEEKEKEKEGEVKETTEMPPPPPADSTTPPQQEPQPEPEPEQKQEPEEEQEQDIDELAKEIRRAECIVESLDGVKVFPLVGTPQSCLYRHLESGKYLNFFDGAFVSTRSAGCLQQPEFFRLLKQDGKGLLAVESAKFMVALGQSQKSEFDNKVLEMLLATDASDLDGGNDGGGGGGGAATAGVIRAKGTGSCTTGGGVVPRRRRDEKDKVDDVSFFLTTSARGTGTVGTGTDVGAMD